MSSEKVWQHDIRSSSAQDLLSVSSRKHLLTSIQDCGNDNILRLSSTKQIIWIDPRFPNTPLLAYSHGRENDRYLSACAVGRGPALTFLTTRNNALTTVYDVSRSVDGLVQLDVLPYAVASEASIYQQHVGQQFVFHGSSMGLVRLSERGAVQYSELQSPKMESRAHCTVETTEEVQNLAAANASLHSDVGPLGRQEFTLFRQHFLEVKVSEDKTAESVYQLIDYFPSYIQNKEAPLEHMLTTYDIAFRAGSEPEHHSRADFLTESLINTKRGYRALKQGCLSPQLVKTPWHRSILPVLRRLDSQFPEDPARSMEYLQTFDLADSESRPSKSHQYELDACHQLTLDLALSSDVYSETSFSKAGEIDQILEVMTEALSLGDEPPPVGFGYLRPLDKALVPEEQKTSETCEMPIGVRLLLKDWDTGHPSDYVYEDPYNGTTSLESSKVLNLAAPRGSNLYVQNQRPPQIMASSAAVTIPPEISRRIVPKVQSQNPFVSYAGFGQTPLGESTDFSQDLAVSTQVLPGRHGGRPGVKKKQTKKRLGGF
ncbi:hypothetical protein GALMADRAFT_221560 [Galerina marginata CBS 339.88]|uniref:Uncharacterized protein n=1 Tax=Galerina marginata (strain CBS 339.88) TaxID=685588 RepID=A0A067TP40_GALM3|nr:hypothetical protein GALMADRAFT_221560 [Galerina marginata CBS 339.88]